MFCQQPCPPLLQLSSKYHPRVECLLDLLAQVDHDMSFNTPSSESRSPFPTHSSMNDSDLSSSYFFIE